MVSSQSPNNLVNLDLGLPHCRHRTTGNWDEIHVLNLPLLVCLQVLQAHQEYSSDVPFRQAFLNLVVVLHVEIADNNILVRPNRTFLEHWPEIPLIKEHCDT